MHGCASLEPARVNTIQDAICPAGKHKFEIIPPTVTHLFESSAFPKVISSTSTSMFAPHQFTIGLCAIKHTINSRSGNEAKRIPAVPYFLEAVGSPRIIAVGHSGMLAPH